MKRFLMLCVFCIISACSVGDKEPSQQVFSMSTQEMIEKYNAAMIKLDKTSLLPSVTSFDRIDDKVNQKFYVLRYGIKENLSIVFYIDKKTDKPYSIAAYNIPITKLDAIKHLYMLGTIGNIFWDNEKRGALLITCKQAIDSNKATEIQLDGMDVICANAGELHVAGISMPISGANKSVGQFNQQ